MTYTVRAQAPAVVGPATKWDYPAGYFPRKFRYLRDAKQAAQTAVDKGSPLARVEYPNGAELDFRSKS